MHISYEKLIDLVSNKGWNIGFHGSAEDISIFSDEKVGQGADANSSLGLFVTYLSASAAEYANAAMKSDLVSVNPAVYVMCFPANKVYHARDREDFYGEDEFGDNCRSSNEFQAQRYDLISRGYDTVEFEDGEDSMAVILKPSQALLVAKINEDLAYELEEFNFESELILKRLTDEGLLPPLEPMKKKDSHPSELSL